MEPQVQNEHLSNVPSGPAATLPLPIETVVADKRFRALCPAFSSIEDQLAKNFPEALAKLRDPDLDYTRAQLALRVRGKVAGPFQLSDFVIVDFARACAEELRQGGPIAVTIDPNDGMRPRFSFGFLAPHIEVAAEDAETGLRAELKALREEIRRGQQLGALGTAQQPLDVSSVRRQLLEEMQLMKNIFGPQPSSEPARNVAAEMKDMAGAMGSMVGSAVNMVKEIGNAGQALNPAATEAAKAQAWLGVAKEGVPLVKEAVGVLKDLTVKPPAGMTEGAKQAMVGVPA